MAHLRKLIETIGLDELLNCIVVSKDIRPAMLIQPADYEEATNKDAITKAKLAAIASQFPELKQSVIQGGEILISKRSYRPEDIKTSADMGKILGYPCAEDYAYTLANKDAAKVGIDIEVHLKPGFNEDRVQLLGYMCRDSRHLPLATAFAKAAEQALKSDPIVKDIIEHVSVSKTDIMPPKYLIQKLIRNEPISEVEEDEIINCIANLEMGSVQDVRYNFKNPVHRGILITLLSLFDNNPMEPFYPLQYRKEMKAVDTIQDALGRELVRAFGETSAAAVGSSRRRRTMKART